MAGANQEGNPERITLKFLDEENTTYSYNAKKHTLLKRFMNAYCDNKGVEKGEVRFLYDGENVNETDSPLSRGMEDGDTIEVFHKVSSTPDASNGAA